MTGTCIAQVIWYGGPMPTATSTPSLDTCAALLRAAPAIGAMRRMIYRTAPPEARGWIGALGIVARHPDGLRGSDVADLLHVDLSVASRHLSDLETLGLVERAPDPTDGRARLQHVTPAGHTWIEAFSEQFAIELQSRLVGWTDADLAALTGLLHRFGVSIETPRTSTDDQDAP